MERLLASCIAFQLRFLSKLMEPGVHSFYHTTYRKATTFLSVYHENKGLCKKNTCKVWKLVWLLTVCTSYPPVIHVIMSLTVTAVCYWTGGSNFLPLVPCIPCFRLFTGFLHWAIFRSQNIKHYWVISTPHYPELLCPCLPPLFSDKDVFQRRTSTGSGLLAF